MRHGLAFGAALAALVAVEAAAVETDGCRLDDRKSVLCGYEVTSLGLTKDSDDVKFMDFNLSVRYRLGPFQDGDEPERPSGALYFAFSGRFGQYVETRESSPVVSKRFEPKFFYRHWLHDDKGSYWDVAYGHESNGQSVNTAADLAAARARAESPPFANDQISRGWDFVEVTRREKLGRDRNYWLEGRLRYFLERGLFQGKPEDYNAWENDREGKSRKEVNGLIARFGYEVPRARESDSLLWRAIAGNWIGIQYETGYRTPFRYNTVRFDLGARIFRIPVNLWVRKGYGSDLAQFYKDTTSKGIELQIADF